MAPSAKVNAVVWDARKVAAEGGLTFKGFGEPSENPGGYSYAAKFAVTQKGVTSETTMLRVRVADSKCFGISYSEKFGKYSMGVVLEDVELFKQMYVGVRGGLLENFTTMMPLKAASVMGRLDEDLRKRLGKAKSPTEKAKLIKEAYANYDAATKERFMAEAEQVVDDALRFVNQKDNMGGMMSSSDYGGSVHHILSCGIYTTSSKDKKNAVLYHDEPACQNPKLELTVNVDGKKLAPADVYPAVCKESSLGTNKVFMASAVLLEMKKINIKADNSMVSVSFRVVQVNKVDEKEEELDLDAEEPTVKRQKTTHSPVHSGSPSGGHPTTAAEEEEGEAADEGDVDDDRI
jgi:hypothetical protein